MTSNETTQRRTIKRTPRTLPTLADGLTVPEQLRKIRGGLTAPMLAQLLGLSRITIYKRAASGEIPSFRVGSALRFDPAAVARWMDGTR